MKRIIILILLSFIYFCSFSQYFGRNKPGYKVFDYKVYSTPNFEIYHYLENDSVIYDLAEKSEQWYHLHQLFFRDTLDYKNPLVFYENHGDFQQTNVTSGMIEIGVGGFTEGLKNRVVMPVSQTSSQTDHVLGHELVHAFQYNYLLSTSGLTIQDINNIPLWMIEGMAEYLSIGSIDPNTAMWLRDDVINNNMPTLYEMSRNYKYNPYRYGQAFWAFTAKTWGDHIFTSLLSQTAKLGYEKAIASQLGVKVEKPKNKVKKKNKNDKHRKNKKSKTNDPTVNLRDFDSLWHTSIINHFKSVMPDTVDSITGKILFDDKNAGDYNFSPVISPNGKYVIFMSEKELFTIDLFIAEVESGKILGRFTKRVNENEIDAFNFIESTGTWSPDSKYFAYSVYKKGKNTIIIIDAEKRKVYQEIESKILSSMTNPTWSPDNNYIAFSAQKNGNTNIYLYDLKEKEIKQITSNGGSNIQPAWSFDSKKIVYVTESVDNNKSNAFIEYKKNLAVYNFEDNTTEIIEIFPGAGNLNPQFSPDDKSIYFLSDRDGFRNLYRYSIDEKKVFQQTRYLTGITGMSWLSPAISISGNGLIVYSYYSKHKYLIYKAQLSEFKEFEVDPDHVDFTAATLPPYENVLKNTVDKMLASREIIKPDKKNIYTALPYRPKFQLDYISNINIGVSTGLISPGAAGGASAIFSDVVGNNQMFVNLNLNGEIYDFGGVLAFMNYKYRFNYGMAISHIPYILGYQGLKYDSITIEEQRIGVLDNFIDLYRIFESRLMFFGFYPLSTTMRFEGAISATRYGYRQERHNYYYDEEIYNYYYGYKKELLDAPDPMAYVSADLAYVIDNSYFGLTAPLRGTRARFQLSKNFGYYDYYSTLFDYRKYTFKKPLCFAFRLLNYNRIGTSADKDVFNSLYIGYPWYIRGYQSSNFNNESQITQDELSINQLRGSKMVVTNAEIRIPFTGPKKLALISSRIFFTDLNLFMDAGLIWDNSSSVVFKWNGGSETKRIPLVSSGISLRINLFGYVILEPYYAFPFQLLDWGKGVFGLNFVPGW